MRRGASSVVAWALFGGLLVGGLGFATDAALLVSRGSLSSPWLAAGLAASALAALLGLGVAPLIAWVHWAAGILARSSALRRLRYAPPTLAALLAGSRLAHSRNDIVDPLRHLHAFEAEVVGFGGAVAVLAWLWTRARGARWARGAGLSVAASAVVFDVATPRPFYRDGHDLAALLAAIGLAVAARPLFDALRGAPARRLAGATAALVIGAAGVLLAVEPVRPGWRAAAVQWGHYVPRLARAARLLVDFDGDGFSPIAWGGDCDDLDGSRSPYAHEVAPGADRNCNGVTLPARPTDHDRGLAPPAGEPALAPGAVHLVVLLTIDCLRADALRPEVTPRLAALSARGLALGRVYAGGAGTLLSLGLVHRGSDAGTPTALLLARRGVVTAGIMSIHQPGLDVITAGFGALTVAPANGPPLRAAEVTDRAVAQLGPGPRYLWAHYADAHAPYEPVPGAPALPRDPRAAYRAELGYVDQEIGRLVDRVEAADPGLAHTVIIATGDHGEGLGAHGISFHGITTWEEVLRVPALVVAPGVTPGGWDGLASHRDIPPTVLGAFGIGPAEGDTELFGRSWLRLRSDPRPALHRFVVSRSYRNITLLRGATSPEAAIVEGQLKLTKTFEDGLRRMYDLGVDPGEARDVEPLRSSDAARLTHDLELYRDLDGFP